MIKCTLRFILFTILFAEGLCRNGPVWSKTYSVSGTLYLPYAELLEPFDAWYDDEEQRSRIDYYHGTVKTYQLGNEGQYGTTIEIVPVTTETRTNLPTCFRNIGSADGPVTPQSILPDISNFKFVGTEIKEGYQCEKWVEIVPSFNRTSSYTMWIRWKRDFSDPSKSEPIPVRYEMKGFNSLIGSHYDHYYLTYKDFTLEQPLPDVFKLPLNVSCGDNEDLKNNHMYNTNPMKEFIDRNQHHSDKAWDSFRNIHSKNYDASEHSFRKNVFNHNLRYIHSSNRKGVGYTLKVNHLADRTDDEMRYLRGGIYKPADKNGDRFPYTAEKIKQMADDLPKDFDWRIRGAVTPVKDQATCGSCWSFAAVGAMEGAYFLKTGRLVRFSEQALVDCTWGYENNGCDGGSDTQSYSWIKKHGGIPTDEEYGSYMGQDGYCHTDIVNLTAPITGFVTVKSNDEEALRVALFNHGPISVFIDASHKSFSFYNNGVFYEPQCSSTNLDHVVLVVGYGTLNGNHYWLVKNSWSNHWGNQGYVLMSTKNNNCGVMTAPSYVNM